MLQHSENTNEDSQMRIFALLLVLSGSSVHAAAMHQNIDQALQFIRTYLEGSESQFGGFCKAKVIAQIARTHSASPAIEYLPSVIFTETDKSLAFSLIDAAVTSLREARSRSSSAESQESH